MGGKIILVSNRLPVKVEKERNKTLSFEKSVGGLATGLQSYESEKESIWIGWPGIASNKINNGEEKKIRTKLQEEFNYYPVFLSRYELKQYYEGFSNKTIWPLFHYFTNFVDYDSRFWNTYRKVNEHFANVILEAAEPGDTIWIHDYHLMLLPGMIRENLPDVRIGYFHHIPFPSFEVFRLLPQRKEILKGLTAADIIGFHTEDYVNHFLESSRHLSECVACNNEIQCNGHTAMIREFPMGIDFEKFSRASDETEVQEEMAMIRKKADDKKIILSIDRLDYSKGILERLEAFDLFLRNNPKYKKKVTLMLVVVPSRTGVKTYHTLKKQIDELVGRINGRHDTIDWNPILYFYRSLPFSTMTAFYNMADVALITPIRDGMNLISKEYLAAKNGTGTLILSEMAGASKELNNSIFVNPNNRMETAKAIKIALEREVDEQIKQNKPMLKRIKTNNIQKWASDFLGALENVKKETKSIPRELTDKRKKVMVSHYEQSHRRLFLFDYDGTLMPFSKNPYDSAPDSRLVEMIERLANHPHNDVVIISGRDESNLEEWFGFLPVGLVAEHGARIRNGNQYWVTPVQLNNQWKESLLPVLKEQKKKVPGSLIEEKKHSLVWHYRSADERSAEKSLSYLKHHYRDFIENKDIDYLEGDKVIEFKNKKINKGNAVTHWTLKSDYDFIMAMGDDNTDEDIFCALDENAYTLKVGGGRSNAAYAIAGVAKVRRLIRSLCEVTVPAKNNEKDYENAYGYISDYMVY